MIIVEMIRSQMATKFDRESNHGIVHFLFNKNIQLLQSFFYPGTEN